MLVCTGGHVGGQEQKHFSPLGTKLYFHVNLSRKNSIVLNPNMAASSCACKPRIRDLAVLAMGHSIFYATFLLPLWMAIFDGRGLDFSKIGFFGHVFK